MQQMKRPSAIILFTLIALLLGTAALAQSSAGYDLSWWTVDGGGTTSNEENGYALGGTIGQPDAAVWSGGDYVLAGGFWGGAATEYRIFLPLVMRGA